MKAVVVGDRWYTSCKTGKTGKSIFARLWRVSETRHSIECSTNNQYPFRSFNLCVGEAYVDKETQLDIRILCLLNF